MREARRYRATRGRTARDDFSLMAPPAHRRSDLADGIRDGLLMMPLSLPLAIAYTIAAKLAGLADWQIVLWSALVYAGSCQLACLSALMTGAGMVELVIITFMANARHGLIAIILSPYLRGVTRRAMPLMAFSLATTSLGLLPARAVMGGNVQIYGLATQLCQYAQWVLFALVGMWLGPQVPASWIPVLSFAVPLSFLGLVVPLIKESSMPGLVCAVVSAVLGLGLTPFWPPQFCAIAAALGGAMAALLIPVEGRHDKR